MALLWQANSQTNVFKNRAWRGGFKRFNNLTGGKIKTRHEKLQALDASLMFEGSMKEAKSANQPHSGALSEREARARWNIGLIWYDTCNVLMSYE